MALKKSAKIKAVKSIDEAVSEYDLLRSKKSIIDGKMKELSSFIKEYAQEHGSKSDTGSYYCQNDSYVFGSQAKKSIKFDIDKAVQFFQSHDFGSVVKQSVVYTIDEDAVEKLIAEGSITLSDLESITETKVSYSVDVKKREAMPEVEQHRTTLAASVKRGRK